MDALKESLAALTYPEQRTKISLIAELLPVIEATHKQGFKLPILHEAINMVIPMPYATFANCLHRVRKAKKVHHPKTAQNAA